MRFLLLFLLIALSGTTLAKPLVVTSIAQIGEPLSVIAGEGAEIISLMGPGVDPHLYRPTRSDIATLARADLIIWTGQSLESKLAPAIAQLARRTPAVALIAHVPPSRLLQDADKKYDPHLWMDPLLWAQALGVATDALGTLIPDHAEAIAARTDAYATQIRTLDQAIGESLSSIPAERRILITAHDAFAYFGRRYGIEVEGVQGSSTESEAGLNDIERLVDLLVARRIPAVFAETSVSERNVRALIEGAAARGHQVVLGGQLFSDAMGANSTKAGTYLGMIAHNAHTITDALGGQSSILMAGGE